MDEQTTWSVIPSKEELYFLAGLLQKGNLIGIEDPFLGFLAEEMEERLDKAKRSLIKQGYMKAFSEEELIIDFGVAAMVESITTSEHLLVATLSIDHRSAHYIIHLTAELLIEQVILPEGDIALIAVRDVHILRERFENFFNLAKVLRDSLSDTHIQPEAIPDLATTLAEGRQINSLVIMRRDGDEMRYAENLSWLLGSQGVWYLQPQKEDEAITIHLTSTTITNIQQRIKQMVENLNNEVSL